MKLFKKAHYNKLLGIEEISSDKQSEIEAAAKLSAENFGAARDIWHPGHGWILKDGKITEAGTKFLEKYYPGS